MIYLDTSAVVPMFVSEPSSHAVDEWLESNEEALVSADWILTEFSSALSLKVRRGEITKSQAARARTEGEIFLQSGLRLLPVPRATFREAARLANNYSTGLRAGDSLHLAMALEANAPKIVTADSTLHRSATTNGIEVIRV
jgi:predicted nucleic acid-binding protein